MKFFIVTILLLFAIAPGEISPPANIQVIYSEKSLDMWWDSVPNASGYNIYTVNFKKTKPAQRQKINQKLITSGTHFTFFGESKNGETNRKMKGYEYHLAITTVCSLGGKEKESVFSEVVDNCYFEGFRNIDCRSKIEKILASTQQTPYLPAAKKVNSRENFIQFMEGPGQLLRKLVKDSINPLQEGGCAPVSTILVKLMDKWGLSAYKIKGLFIKEFHTFVIINIDGVEYILDFTADQFVPNVSPVFFPRDYSHLNGNGKLSADGKPVYQIEKIYSPDQTELAEGKTSQVYRNIFDKVASSKK